MIRGSSFRLMRSTSSPQIVLELSRGPLLTSSGQEPGQPVAQVLPTHLRNVYLHLSDVTFWFSLFIFYNSACFLYLYFTYYFWSIYIAFGAMGFLSMNSCKHEFDYLKILLFVFWFRNPCENLARQYSKFSCHQSQLIFHSPLLRGKEGSQAIPAMAGSPCESPLFCPLSSVCSYSCLIRGEWLWGDSRDI